MSGGSVTYADALRTLDASTLELEQTRAVIVAIGIVDRQLADALCDLALDV